MDALLPKLDATRLAIALKTTFAIVLGFAIALRLDWKPSFTAIVIVVLQTDALGATIKKGLLYIAGTLGGAMVAVAMVALFAHDRRLFTLGMALVTGCSLYRLQGSRYPYAWLIFIVTVALVAWLSAQSTDVTFELAVMRASTVCLGIVVAYAVHGILWPINAGRAFDRQLHGFLEACRGLVSATKRAAAGGNVDAESLRRTESAQVRTIAALRKSLDAAAVDTARFQRFHASYSELIDHLRELLLSILSVREGIDRRMETMTAAAPSPGFDDIRSTLDEVQGHVEDLVRDLSRPRDGTLTAPELDAPAGAEIPTTGHIDAAFDAMIAEDVEVLASRVMQVRAALPRVEDPRNATAPPRPTPREPFSLKSMRFRKAAGGSVVVVLMASLFILTQWPTGLSLGMVFGTLAVGFGGLLPLMTLRRHLLLSLVIAPAIAAPLYFGIMPRIDQYEELIPWLFIAFVPLLYVQAGRNPKTTIMAIFSSIFLIALLSLDEEHQSYSFSSFLGMWLGFCGGFAISLAIFSLFSSLVPEREFWKQTRSFFADCGHFMQGLETSAPSTPAGAAIVRHGQERWLGSHSQLKMWSRAIDYERVRQNDRHKTEALIEAIERMALHLDSAAEFRQQYTAALDTPLLNLLSPIYDACAESCQLIAKSLADFELIPHLPETRSALQAMESRGADFRRSSVDDDNERASTFLFMSATARLSSLANTIHDCRDKANALDWAAWNRNYF